MIKFVCPVCGKDAVKPTGEVNRARRQGLPIRCGRVCAGIARRQPPKSYAQKAEEKRLYDIEYRAKNLAKITANKRAYFQATYDPDKAAIERKKTMARHVEYCRSPEYKAWKKEYDRRLRASEFGEFGEAYLLLLDLDREIDSRATWLELAEQKGTINKTQKRKRSYEQLIGHQS